MGCYRIRDPPFAIRYSPRIDMLRIYGIARTRAFRAIWMAKELGLDYQHIPTETGAAGARKPDYLAINPNGRLPAIDDDGFVLWESLAITLFLAKKHALGRLYPATPEDEAKAWQWSLWAVQEVDRGVNIWSLHAVRLPPAERNSQLREEALKVLAPPFRVLDGALADRDYLLGHEFTVADPQRRRRHQPGDRDGSVGNAAPRRLAPQLPRPSGRPRSEPAAPAGRRHCSGRDHAGNRQAKPAMRRRRLSAAAVPQRLDAAAKRLRLLGKNALGKPPRRRRMVRLPLIDRRREPGTPRRQRSMRRGQSGEHDEVMVRAQTFAQPLRLRYPQLAQARPHRLDEFHLVAVRDDALAQLMQLFGLRLRPCGGQHAPRPPVLAGKLAGEIAKGHILQGPGIDRVGGARERRMELLAQLRRQRHFSRPAGVFDTGAHSGKRRFRQVGLGLFQIGKRVERSLGVAGAGELVRKIARVGPQPAVLGPKEWLDQPEKGAPALHRLAEVVNGGRIAAVGFGERRSALGNDIVSDRDESRPHRLAGPQRCRIAHGA